MDKFIEELEKAKKTVIEINNKQILEVELKDNRLIFTKKDDKDNVERRDAVLGGEIVLLYNYILHQRDNDLELF